MCFLCMVLLTGGEALCSTRLPHPTTAVYDSVQGSKAPSAAAGQRHSILNSKATHSTSVIWCSPDAADGVPLKTPHGAAQC